MPCIYRIYRGNRKRKKLTLPYYPTADSTGGHDYRTTSWWHHLVAEYTGLTLVEVGRLDYLVYLTWRRDAYIHKLNSTEKGKEYLDNAWRMEQTKPDREALRRKLKKGDTVDGK